MVADTNALLERQVSFLLKKYPILIDIADPKEIGSRAKEAPVVSSAEELVAVKFGIIDVPSVRRRVTKRIAP